MPSDRPRIPVILQSWQEALRRLSETVNFLLEQVEDKAAIWGKTGALSLNTTPLEVNGYSNDLDSSFLDANATTGRVTVFRDALYTVSATVVLENPTQNNDYVLTVMVDGVVDRVVVTQFGAAPQQNYITLNGQVRLLAQVGQAISIALAASGSVTGLTYNSASFAVESWT